MNETSERLTAALEALVRYGQHIEGCTTIASIRDEDAKAMGLLTWQEVAAYLEAQPKPCNCGLDMAIDLLRQTPR